MATFLTTRGTTSEIEKIINNAEHGVVLISPYIKIPDSLFQNLLAADRRGINITFVYGKNKTLESNTKGQFNQLKNLKVYFLDNLHAKCYFNEQAMVITSLNLFDFSEQNNREMGILVTQLNEKEVFTEAIKEAKMIISLASLESNIQAKQQYQIQVGQPSTAEVREPGTGWLKELRDILPGFFGQIVGYCIECRKKIEYDENRPYCPDCYRALNGKKFLSAHYCHMCGRKSTTTLNKPLCHSCVDNNKPG
jgi:hypothetical protein